MNGDTEEETFDDDRVSVTDNMSLMSMEGKYSNCMKFHVVLIDCV